MNDVPSILTLLFAAATLGSVLVIIFRKPPAPSQEILTALSVRLDALEKGMTALGQSLHHELATARGEQAAAANTFRTDFLSAQRDQTNSLLQRLDAFAQAQREQLDASARTHREHLTEIRNTIERSLSTLREENSKKLDEMRATVDEKLQSTLEKRLGESFKQVSERLENVHKTLGEMQAIAADVGDLKRVLTNVRARGIWGEIQLGTILADMLLPEQYATNVKPNPHTQSFVEFAIRLPGPNDTAPLWLPIDAKFPKEDYECLVDAAERADAEGVDQAARNLCNAVEKAARDIRDKYIFPPHTTDFAILFLPTEGLYAEVLRRPGIADKIHREYRIVLAGPTTLAALLNSLQIGFRTLAIQKRSSEVSKLLGAIKTQFGQFGDLLSKVHEKLEDASKIVGKATERHRIIGKRLSSVEALPEGDAAALLPGNDT